MLLRVIEAVSGEHDLGRILNSSDSHNYIKYLEVTGKGGVAHEYLKYDSKMYQDLLRSVSAKDAGLRTLAAQDEHSIADENKVGHGTQIVEKAQELYEKLALEFGNIADTNEAYRDRYKLISDIYGSSHEKVGLYRSLVKDVSILHSKQLGMNINNLPKEYNENVAKDIYHAVADYSDKYKLDTNDKDKIANQVYEQHFALKAWEHKADENIALGSYMQEDYTRFHEKARRAAIGSAAEHDAIASHQQKTAQEILKAQKIDQIFTVLAKDQSFFIELGSSLKYEYNNDHYKELINNAVLMRQNGIIPKLREVVAEVSKHGIFSEQEILNTLKSDKNLTTTYEHFDKALERHQLDTRHQVIQQNKENAKTVDSMIEAVSCEHEFFKSLDGTLKYAIWCDHSLLSAISNAKTTEQDLLVTNMHNRIGYIQKHNILSESDIINRFNKAEGSYGVIKDLGKICEKHYMNHHNNNIKMILEDDHINIGSKKYSCPLKYIKHEMKDNMPDFVDERNIHATFAKVQQEVKELRLEKELAHTMNIRF